MARDNGEFAIYADTKYKLKGGKIEPKALDGSKKSRFYVRAYLSTMNTRKIYMIANEQFYYILASFFLDKTRNKIISLNSKAITSTGCSTTRPTQIPPTPPFTMAPYVSIVLDPDTLAELIMANYTGDLTGCLLNCSSNGECIQNLTSEIISCLCYQNFTGDACDLDMRACSSLPCLNGGTCVDILTNLTFSCTCDPYYTGPNCATKIDVCANEICSSHGSCADVNNTAMCKCYQNYFGSKCENEQESLKTVKKVIRSTSIIAIIFLILFYLIFVASDFHSWYIGRNRRRRREEAKKQPQEKSVNLGAIRYKYVQ